MPSRKPTSDRCPVCDKRTLGSASRHPAGGWTFKCVTCGEMITEAQIARAQAARRPLQHADVLVNSIAGDGDGPGARLRKPMSPAEELAAVQRAIDKAKLARG